MQQQAVGVVLQSQWTEAGGADEMIIWLHGHCTAKLQVYRTRPELNHAEIHDGSAVLRIYADELAALLLRLQELKDGRNQESA